MEMNTRLQVEHPVTEFITGLDLVEWQLRVAAGEALPSMTPRIDGHAIEVRIYAEDPSQEYRPSVGKLIHLRTPATESGVRIDTGVRRGDRIGIEYDPMIAKLIVHGTDRPEALRRLQVALSEFEVVGVETNLRLLRGIAADADFAAGGVDTGFLGRHPELLAPPATDPPPAAIAAAVLAVTGRDRAESPSPWAARDSWRMNLEGSRSVPLRYGTATITVAVRALPDGASRLTWGSQTHVAALHAEALHLDERVIRCTAIDAGATVVAIVAGQNHAFECSDPLAPPDSTKASAGRIMAPIPGRVASVLVAPGDHVKRGQALVVLEAMKMELTLSAGADGVVRDVRCRKGDMVEERVELVTFAD
jgi:3-methylcrotonyl-CoA carboxylase alpha subunit